MGDSTCKDAPEGKNKICSLNAYIFERNKFEKSQEVSEKREEKNFLTCSISLLDAREQLRDQIVTRWCTKQSPETMSSCNQSG